jgi:hypothetical protein
VSDFQADVKEPNRELISLENGETVYVALGLEDFLVHVSEMEIGHKLRGESPWRLRECPRNLVSARILPFEESTTRLNRQQFC